MAWRFGQSWQTRVILDYDARRDCHSPYHGAMRHELEKLTEEFKYAIKFDKDMKCHFKEEMTSSDSGIRGIKAESRRLVRVHQFELDFQEKFDKIIKDPSVPEAGKVFATDVVDDTYLNVKLAIPRDGDGLEYARVTKRLRDKDGLPTASYNPILQKRMYEVEYPDGHKASLGANAIAKAETMFA
jgi:hypothetical protein